MPNSSLRLHPSSHSLRRRTPLNHLLWSSVLGAHWPLAPEEIIPTSSINASTPFNRNDFLPNHLTPFCLYPNYFGLIMLNNCFLYCCAFSINLLFMICPHRTFNLRRGASSYVRLFPCHLPKPINCTQNTFSLIFSYLYRPQGPNPLSLLLPSFHKPYAPSKYISTPTYNPSRPPCITTSTYHNRSR